MCDCLLLLSLSDGAGICDELVCGAHLGSMHCAMTVRLEILHARNGEENAVGVQLSGTASGNPARHFLSFCLGLVGSQYRKFSAGGGFECTDREMAENWQAPRLGCGNHDAGGRVRSGTHPGASPVASILPTGAGAQRGARHRPVVLSATRPHSRWSRLRQCSSRGQPMAADRPGTANSVPNTATVRVSAL